MKTEDQLFACLTNVLDLNPAFGSLGENPIITHLRAYYVCRPALKECLDDAFSQLLEEGRRKYEEMQSEVPSRHASSSFHTITKIFAHTEHTMPFGNSGEQHHSWDIKSPCDIDTILKTTRHLTSSAPSSSTSAFKTGVDDTVCSYSWKSPSWGVSDASQKESSTGSPSVSTNKSTVGVTVDPPRKYRCVHWTDEEDAILRQEFAKHGTRWKLISQEVSKVPTSPTRTASSVRERARRVGLIGKELEGEVEFVGERSLEERNRAGFENAIVLSDDE